MTVISQIRSIRSKLSGFTMIEILVSIVIMGIITSIIAVSYSGVRKQVEISQINSDLKTAAVQLANDFSKYAKFPNTLAESGDGKGVSFGSNGVASYQYNPFYNTYCVSITKGELAYHITSTEKVVVSGVCGSNFNWKMISSGSDHVCGISNNDRAYCWGSNEYGQLGNNSTANSAIPIEVSRGVMSTESVKQITSGRRHTCAVDFNDKAYCWGNNDYGQLGNNSTNSSSMPVAVSQGNMPAGQVKQLISSYSHTCAIASNDNVYCWGINSSGQIGNNSTTNSLTPATVSQGVMPVGVIKQLAVGSRQTCVIASDNKVYCWGDNGEGQLGNGSNTDSLIPVLVSLGAMPAGAVKQITSSGASVCAIASDDKGYCWGYNDYGELGNNTYVPSNLPVAVLQGAMPVGVIKKITLGNYHACAIASDDRLYCWGGGDYGQLGNNTYDNSAIPIAVSQGASSTGLVKQITAGYYHTCVIASDDKSYCWGYNYYGQLGHGHDYLEPTPTNVSNGVMSPGTIKQLAAGNYHTCAIASDDRAYCWGSNGSGLLGNNSTTGSPVPVAISQGVMPAGIIKQISAKDDHTCVIASNDKPYCWGSNEYGELGNNSTTDSSVPVAVSQGVMPTGAVKQLALAAYHTCAIASNDKVYCWGENSFNQLGNGTTTDSHIPVEVSQGAMPAGAIKQITAGYYNTCVIASDDKVYCWGYNNYGQLGTGNTTAAPVPVAVAQGAIPAGAIKQLSSGVYHACVIASDDKPYCWGYNYHGQLGINSTTDNLVPIAVNKGAMPVGTVKKLAINGFASCVIASDDKSYCWGYNYYGLLGNNSTDNSSIPVAVHQGVMPSGAIKQIVGSLYSVCAIASDNKAYCWGINESGLLGNPLKAAYNDLVPNLVVSP